MDPVIIALIAKAATASILQVRDIFNNKSLSYAEKEAKVAELLVEVKDNARKSYADYDPDLDKDLIDAKIVSDPNVTEGHTFTD